MLLFVNGTNTIYLYARLLHTLLAMTVSNIKMDIFTLLAWLTCIGTGVHFQLSNAFAPQPTFRFRQKTMQRRRLDRRIFNQNNVGDRSNNRRSPGLSSSESDDQAVAVLEISNLEEPDVSNANATKNAQPMDRRPHEQRVSGPRKARRLNHPFQHLYRHSDPYWNDNSWNDTVATSDEVYQFYSSTLMSESSTFDARASEEQSNSTFAQQPIDVRTSLLAIQYLNLHGGYAFEEIRQMHAGFPPLLEVDVIRHFRPKMRFLKDCLGGSTAEQLLDPRLKAILPSNFFGSRLERTIAPRHAFLAHVGLPEGKALWDDTHKTNGGALLEEFLLMHRKPKQFAAMCNKWKKLYGSTIFTDNLPITSEQIVAFDKLFQRGILSAARDDSVYIQPEDTSGGGNATRKTTSNSPSLLQTANTTSAQLVRYLIQHGANPWETDVRGASLFHWAAGCGNLDGLQELVECCDQLESSRVQVSGLDNSTAMRNPGVHAALLWKASRDDATPLHWAAAGAGPKEFGIGGHISVCNYLLSLCTEYPIIPERKLINGQTRDGNTILMWSAWSRSLDIVKLLVRSRAETTRENRNGCTVAHWAASGGDTSVCKYLHKMANVDFTVENFARNTPLSHSVAYGRFEVAKWLKEDLKVEDTGGNAEDLASDFVNWADMGVGLIAGEEEVERRSVYSLFNSFNDWRDEDLGESDGNIDE